MKNTSFILIVLLIAMLFIFLSTPSLSLTSKKAISNAPTTQNLVLNNSVYNAILAPPVNTTPVDYCEIPTILTQGFNPEIDGRTVVYGTVVGGYAQNIAFYDLGIDHKKSADDRGVFQPFQTPIGGNDFDFHIYGNNIVFARSINNGLSGIDNFVMLYYLGNDSMIGTSDDIGPVQIYNASYIFTQTSIDQDYIGISQYNNLMYCSTSNISQGSCMSGSIYQINPINGTNYYKSKITGSGNFWEYLFEINDDINYIDSSGANGTFYNNKLISDVAYPFILSVSIPNSTNNNSANSTNSTNNNSTAIGTSITLGLIGLPQIQIPISSNTNSTSSDRDASFPHRISNSGEYFMSWIRTYPNNQKDYIVSSFPSNIERIVPYNISWGESKPFTDDNTLVFSGFNQVYISECY